MEEANPLDSRNYPKNLMAERMINVIFTWSSDTADIELMAVVDFEVLLHYRSFDFARTVDGRKEVFWIDFVMYPLIAGEAYACQ
jgi:uncharacterized membrane protein